MWPHKPARIYYKRDKIFSCFKNVFKILQEEMAHKNAF